MSERCAGHYQVERLEIEIDRINALVSTQLRSTGAGAMNIVLTGPIKIFNRKMYVHTGMRQ